MTLTGMRGTRAAITHDRAGWGGSHQEPPPLPGPQPRGPFALFGINNHAKQDEVKVAPLAQQWV